MGNVVAAPPVPVPAGAGAVSFLAMQKARNDHVQAVAQYIANHDIAKDFRRKKCDEPDKLRIRWLDVTVMYLDFWLERQIDVDFGPAPPFVMIERPVVDPLNFTPGQKRTHYCAALPCGIVLTLLLVM